MLFHENIQVQTHARFLNLLELLPSKKRSELSSFCFEQDDLRFAFEWICVNSPYSDLFDYPVQLFFSAAEHGVFLRGLPHAKELEEEIFLSYVLHPRVKDEELSDCRKFFFHALKRRLNFSDLYEDALKVNEFLAENVSYLPTDDRTRSARAIFDSGFGRCGEESVLAVNVYRAVGIPARQIYCPRWSHCGDNHAWVEIRIKGEWKFLGACEMEDQLNRGWFIGAAKRAVFLHSRCFGTDSEEEIVSKSGPVCYLNRTQSYAKTKVLNVCVEENGLPASGALVSFCILNDSSFYPAAECIADEKGMASLRCGYGSIWVVARKGVLFCETLVSELQTEAHCDLQPVQRKESVREILFSAPPAEPWESEGLGSSTRAAAAAKLRENKAASLFDEPLARKNLNRFGYCEEIFKKLSLSRNNFLPLLSFLENEKFSAKDKESLFLLLCEKDLTDIDPTILEENLSLPYPERNFLFFPYVLNPRVLNEPLTCCRRTLRLRFSDPIFRDPQKIMEELCMKIKMDSKVQDMYFSELTISPLGALESGIGDPLSIKILFVNICRALGIPARLNPMNGSPEYFRSGAFIPVKPIKKVSLSLCKQEKFLSRSEFSLSVKKEGKDQKLSLEDYSFENDVLSLEVEPGEYRLITQNRLPNGNLRAVIHDFTLQTTGKRIPLRKAQAKIEEMLAKIPIPKFNLSSPSKSVSSYDLIPKGGVLIWLGKGEPTEHLRQETERLFERFQNCEFPLYYICENRESLDQEFKLRPWKALQNAEFFFDSEGVHRLLARQLFLEPDNLPLIAVCLDSETAVFACAGYQIGSAEMILNVCEFLTKRRKEHETF